MKKNGLEWEISKKTTQIRLLNKKTQRDISKILVVSPGYIGQIESQNFKSIYTYKQLNKLALYYACSPKDFMPHQGIIEENENTAENSKNEVEGI